MIRQQTADKFFDLPEYYEFKSKIYSNCKKNIDARIQRATETYTGQIHSSEGADQILIDGAHFNFYYEGESLQFPCKMLELKNFKHLFNVENIKQNLDQSEMEELYEYLPEGNKNQKGLLFALTGSINSGANPQSNTEKDLAVVPKSPLQDFQRLLKRGFYSQIREKQDSINRNLNQDALRNYYINLFEEIKKQRLQKGNGFKPQIQQHMEQQEQSLIQSVHQLSFLNDFSDNSDNTESEQQVQQEFQQQLPKRIFFKYDYSKIKTPQELLTVGQQKIEKKIGIIKNMIIPRPRNQQWIENYRKQELQRYSYPTKPWNYITEDGRKVIVAPVAKKMSVLTGKPRDHPLLKIQRPACVTILTLVRDAAARLPNSVGTRADICELLKESQYVNQDIAEDKLSNIVSGALDRLHYMSDACVKYDAEKKLWIYLHTQRNQQHPSWGDQGDQYIDKKPKKKKNDYQ